VKKVFTRFLWATVVLTMAAAFLLFGGALPYRAFIVDSDSMGDRGSIVIVNQGHFRVGQAITFKGPRGERVTHDLIGFRSDGTAITKGSANRTADPGHAPRSAIIGGVVATVPGGWIILSLRTPLGLGILIILLIAVIACVFGGISKKPSETVEVEPGRDPATEPAS